jgi:hypothetical protein
MGCSRRSLGGTSNALLAGLAADAAQRMGRVTAGDGAVMLSIPVNERTDGDTRANAVTNVDVTVDPRNATTDLRGIRAAIKQALVHHNAVPDERLALLPIVPLVPKRLMRRMVSVATGNAASVVSSNLGEVPSAVTRPAPTRTTGAVRLQVTRATSPPGGVWAISGRVNGRSASRCCHQPGRARMPSCGKTLSVCRVSLNATMENVRRWSHDPRSSSNPRVSPNTAGIAVSCDSAGRRAAASLAAPWAVGDRSCDATAGTPIVIRSATFGDGWSS